MSINLPTSLGEAIDKLNILDLKLHKIKNPDRLKYVQSEYDELFAILEPYVKENKFYYSILYKVNEKIWDVQDDLRLSIIPQSNESYKIICDENDRRCRIKNKINSKAQSKVREQKGYPMKRALVCSHMGLGDMICMIGIVRYLSTIYDEVIVMVKDNYLNNVKLFYEDDDTIKFCIVQDPNAVRLVNGSKIDENTTVYCCGYHSFGIEHVDYAKYLPDIFYSQMGLEYSIASEYFYIDTAKYENDPIVENLINREYYFVHDVASTEDTKISEKLLEQNPNILIINPNKNIYVKDTEYYNINLSLQKKPLAYFLPIISNAKQIHCVDSSFFNLINFADTTKAERVVAYPRSNNKYPSFNKFEYIYEN